MKVFLLVEHLGREPVWIRPLRAYLALSHTIPIALSVGAVYRLELKDLVFNMLF